MARLITDQHESFLQETTKRSATPSKPSASQDARIHAASHRSTVDTPSALLDKLNVTPGMETGQRRLILLLTQLGDFDSTEYAQALTPALPQILSAGIAVQAFAIGDPTGADRFCDYTGFPRQLLNVEPNADLHQACGLYAGLNSGAGAWPDLLLMCAGIGSPGTLAEVFRGYRGDRSAPQRFDSGLFRLAGGEGFQRPFELATVRLNNMVEVLGRWKQYVPDDRFIAQRGGTFLLEADDSLLYGHRDKGILGFSETMNRPLSFLDPYL